MNTFRWDQDGHRRFFVEQPLQSQSTFVTKGHTSLRRTQTHRIYPTCPSPIPACYNLDTPGTVAFGFGAPDIRMTLTHQCKCIFTKVHHHEPIFGKSRSIRILSYATYFTYIVMQTLMHFITSNLRIGLVKTQFYLLCPVT